MAVGDTFLEERFSPKPLSKDFYALLPVSLAANRAASGTQE